MSLDQLIFSLVNAQAPTFPPKQIDHSTYPWIDPVEPLPVSNDSDANALCYLITTANHTPPVPPKINYTGTWVTTQPSDPNRGAIMCMNRAQFWEEWLLPLLQVINLGTQIQAAPPVLQPYQTQGATVGLRFVAGTCFKYPDFTDAYYKFVSEADGKSWTWKADSSLLSTTNSMTNDGTTFTLTQTGRLSLTVQSSFFLLMMMLATANTKVIFPSGDGRFNITGQNTVHAECISSGGGFDSQSQ